MSTNMRGWFSIGRIAVAFGLLAQSLWAATGPSITGLRAELTNVVVTVEVPAGLRRVMLESRERVGAGAWVPRAVARLQGEGGTVEFRLPQSRTLELLRIRGDERERLPASFFGGTNDFAVQPAEAGGMEGEFMALDGRNGTGIETTTTTVPGSATVISRAVTESDIWQIRGQTLYFFNQNRGLQVIDLTQPDVPVVTGTLSLPAVGEQMYLLGQNEMVLLARSQCTYGSQAAGEVLVVRDIQGNPTVLTRLPLPGYITESRMVGSALYVASQNYRQVTNTTDATSGSTTWEWGTVVTSFDLTDPEAPVQRGSIWCSGYGHRVAANDRFFFVIQQQPNNWQRSVVQLIDISAVDGTMELVGLVRPIGEVPDKFKVDLQGDILTVISEARTTNLVTWLETFSLTRPAEPRRLGQLSFGPNERLHATRFAGDRVYVVTFHVEFRMDPLWVVDLSDPAHPAIKGQLEIPGWSTFLEPWGNRLVALGIETNRTTVSLFDVEDPSRPGLLSRVTLGEGWSWSEANWDEKAMKVLPEAGLVLVPYSSSGSNEWTQAVQLIDLFPDRLVARGNIARPFQPRRAALHGERVLAVSGRELLSVDITDRDQPTVRGEAQLSWVVQRVFVEQNYLLELNYGESSPYYSYIRPMYFPSEPPTIRVAFAESPDQVLATFTLTNLPVLGVTKKDQRLYVLQGVEQSLLYYPIDFLPVVRPMNSLAPMAASTLSADSSITNQPPVTNGHPWVLTVIDLAQLPELPVVGEASGLTAFPLGRGALPLWPKPDVLVWFGGSASYYYYPCLNCFTTMSDAMVRSILPWYPSSGGGYLAAFTVGTNRNPTLVSELNLRGTNWSYFSNPVTADGLVYLSHRVREFVPGLDTPWRRPAMTNIYQSGNEIITNVTPAGSWVQRHYLDVVDYADPATPTVREPLSLPGKLEAVAYQGALLYTYTSVYEDMSNGTYRTSYQLDALGYDGVSVHRVDTLPLPQYYPRVYTFNGANFFLSRTGEDPTITNRQAHYLESWTLPATGKFTLLDQLTSPTPIYQMKLLPDLLAVRQTDRLQLIDVSNPGDIKVLHEEASNLCLGYDLDHAEGDVTRGLWVPLYDYGVGRIFTGKP